ncbi:MAG: hypothetical protein NC541_15280 [bacterium]|nr:hypothetical protein [bacterium]
MPRVALSAEQKEEYMIGDLPFLLEKEARKKGLKQKDLADAIGITQQAFTVRKRRDKRGKPKDTFSYGELLKLLRLLDMPEEQRAKLLMP